MTKLKILVVQPCIPAYRKSFFSLLAERIIVYLIAGKTDIDGLPSVSVPTIHMDLKGSSLRLGLGLLWQKGVAFTSLIEFDALVMGGNLRYLSSLLLLLQARLCSKPVVWWGQARSKSLVGLKGKSWLMSCLADTVIVYSDKERMSLINQGLGESRVFSIRNTIDCSAVFSEKKKWGKKSLETFSRDQGLYGKDVILVLGRGMPKARFDLLPIVSKELLKDFPDHQFVCIGEDEKSTMAMEILNQCGNGKIRFLGRMDDEQLAPYALSSRLFFYPGDVGLSLHHAFAYGLPAVIHSESTWHMPECDIFQENYNGVSFSRGNAQSAAKSIARIFQMNQSAVLGENARNTLIENYSIEGMVGRMQNAIAVAVNLRRK